MSRGSPIVPIRIPADLLAELEDAMNSANLTRREELYTRTSWIIAAIREKLRHRERSKKAGKGKSEER